MSNIAERFFRGDSQKLVAEFADKPASHLTPIDRAYIIGALVFVGRRQDAIDEYKRCQTSFVGATKHEAHIICRFFLGVGACRDSSYEEARRYFWENFKIRHEVTSKAALFYVYQGFGFYRNFSSRYAKSLLWVTRAWSFAFQIKFTFGMLLSADLKGHDLVQIGKVGKGLRSLDQAHQYAKDLGQGGFANAVEVGRLCYRSQHGLIEPEELVERIKATAVSDTYSISNLTLEIVRGKTFRGQTTEAREWLHKAASEVFQFGHRRQKATLLFREAYLEFLSGNSPLENIQKGLALIDHEIDLLHRLELRGLQYKFQTETLGEVAPELKAEVDTLTRLTGRAIARRIQLRPMKVGLINDDAIGNLLDRIDPDQANVSVLRPLVERRWFGPLREISPKRSQFCLTLGLVPHRLVVVDHGNVYVGEEYVTPTLKRLLLVLAKGTSEKKDLVEMVWGYSYDSLRHDSLLYTSIHRLRKLLGPFEDILMGGEGGYFWKRSLVCRVIEHHATEVVQNLEENSESELNIRQLELLAHMKRFPQTYSVNIEKHAATFGVSKATATRDLSELVSKGYFSRIGRGKAVAYMVKGRSSKDNERD